MPSQIIIVLVLTFIINLIATLSYGVRIVAVRTGRIAVSFALFNILVLVSRTANGFQAPLLAKTIETDLTAGVTENEWNFRLIVLSCTIASVVGAILIPSFQRILARAVNNFSINKSMSKLILHAFTRSGITYLRDNLTLPSREILTSFKPDHTFPYRIFILNIVAVSIITIGVLSSVYAAYLNPEFRTTASNLSALINGGATILMFVFIDPFLSSMTDDVSQGKCPESVFRRFIVYMVAARVLGTIVAQLLFVPAARAIAWVADYV